MAAQTADTKTTETKTTATQITDAIDASTKKVEDVQDALLNTAKQGALASIDIYEKSVGTVLDLQKKLVVATGIAAFDDAVAAQTKLVEDINAAGVSAARSVEKVSTGPAGFWRTGMNVVRSAMTASTWRPVRNVVRSSQWLPMSPTARRAPPRSTSSRQFQSVSNSSQSWK